MNVRIIWKNFNSAGLLHSPAFTPSAIWIQSARRTAERETAAAAIFGGNQ
jgi:hypothetical protein